MPLPPTDVEPVDTRQGRRFTPGIRAVLIMGGGTANDPLAILSVQTVRDADRTATVAAEVSRSSNGVTNLVALPATVESY